jgi:hypothetical protein
MNLTHRVVSVLLFSSLAIIAAAQGGVEKKLDGSDTSTLDVAIAKAEAKASGTGADAADKRAAAEALLERGNIYYNAQQPRLYKFALADMRRALKYQPDLAEAREKVDQMEAIYRSLDRPIPINGSEPPEKLNETVAAARRLELKGEPSSATANDEIDAGGVKDYVFTAKAGQSYAVSVHSEKQLAHFNFYRVLDGVPVRWALDTDVWAGEIKQGGDYMIRVGPARAKIAFTLGVNNSKAAETRKF